MDITKIVLLLQNAGLQNIKVGRHFIEFDDPACIYAAFDTFVEFAWVVIVILTAIMLFGWGVLYIKNGTKIEHIFNNAKTVILILFILSLVKPIINVIYGDDLFSKGCDKKRVSLTAIQELIELRNQNLPQSDEELFEIFDLVDSGTINSYPTDVPPLTAMNNTQPVSINSARNVNTYETQSQNASSLFSSVGGFIKATFTRLATIYINIKGEKVQRSGGSAAWRNNNPGNIRKSQIAYSFGAIGETESWAVFPDEETGLNAIVKLLRSKNYNKLTIQAAIHRWAPFADGNDPVGYSKKVSKMTGLPANARINTLTDDELRNVANAIKVVEGWKVGREQKI